MTSIGVDIGSTYTKYCVLDEQGEIARLWAEKTPIRQDAYFQDKVRNLGINYPEAKIISCGYGKKNIDAMKNISELVALAKGVNYVLPDTKVVLDIGGQDTKVIQQAGGQIRKFFINDKCAAGSGMFLANTLNLLQVDFQTLDLTKIELSDSQLNLSSTCAVFAQTEIVKLIAANHTETEISYAVIKHILTRAKPLLRKVPRGEILLTGGLSQIPGIAAVASEIFDQPVKVYLQGKFLAAIGCAL